MDDVWLDCDIFDSRIVCTKAPSIYICMARLVKITGLEWAKIYETPQYIDIDYPKGDVLSMSQTTQIKIEPKYYTFLVNYLDI